MSDADISVASPSWSQTWHDLFFAHWQVPVEALRPHLPPCLAVDAWMGTAWISIVAFRLDIRRRGLPAFGFASDFVELNVRTYVRWRGQPGIYFLSIHAGKRTAVALARMLTPLPYVYAPLSYRRSSDRFHLLCPHEATSMPLLEAEFSTLANAAPVPRDSVDAWLLERYWAFVPDHRRMLQVMVAQHPAWSIQSVGAPVNANHLCVPWGVDAHRQPDLVHFAARMPALIWPFWTVQDGLA